MRFVLVVALAVAGCALGAPEPQRFVLGGEDVEVSPTSLTFPIETHPEFAGAQPNDFVAGIQAGGYVRRILAVGRADDRYEVATEDVTLGEAVGEAETQSSLDGGKADGSTDLSFDFERTGIVLLEQPGVSISIDRAAISFRPRLDVDLQFGNWELQHFLVHAHGELDGDITVAVRADATGTWKLERQTWRDVHTFIQWFGWVPVVETVELAIGVGAEVTAESPADITVGGGFTSGVGAGVEYIDDDWRAIGTTNMRVSGTPPVVTVPGAIGVNAYVYAELRVRMYGAAGPFVKIMPGLRLRHDAAGATTRTVGMRGTGGAELANPFGDNLRYEAKLFDVASKPF
jgi:hypothetical protein